MNYIILFVFALFTNIANAANLFEPAKDDISLKLINQLFGGLFNGGNDIFGMSISVFNGAILTVGGILAAYTILAGTLGTAHDGEMLGKKFSSMWLPIRYGLGTALILPILPGGYCIMQSLVAWVIVQGVGLADTIWESYADSSKNTAAINFPQTAQATIRKVAENAFIASVCVNAHKKHIADTIAAAPDTLDLNSRYSYGISAKDNTFLYGDRNAGLKSACGWLKLPKNIENNAVASGAKDTSSTSGLFGNLDTLFTVPDLSSLNAAHIAQTAKLVGAMDSLAAEVIDNSEASSNPSKYYEKIDKATKDYLDGILKAAQSVSNKNANAQTKDGKEFGWGLAGANFINIIATNNKIQSFMQNFPSSSGSIDIKSGSDMQEAVTKMQIGSIILASRSVEYSNQVGSEQYNIAESEHKNSETGISGKIGSALAEAATTIDIYNLKNDERHSIIKSGDLGNRLMSMYAALLTVLPALSLGTGWIPGAGPAIQGFISTAMSLLMLPLAALLAVGFACAYIIPYTPFLIWIAAFFAYIIQCVEAILVAPLWAVMHLHPNGDDLTGKGANGYTLILGLLLRPAFLVFGFIAALGFSYGGGQIIDKIFYASFSMSNIEANGTMGFLGMIGGTIVYCGLLFWFIKKCFSIITIIPDEVMKWIGGGNGGLSGAAQTAQQETSKTFTTVTPVLNNMTQAMNNKMGGREKPATPNNGGNGGNNAGGDNPNDPDSFQEIRAGGAGAIDKEKSNMKDSIKDNIKDKLDNPNDISNANSNLDNAVRMAGSSDYTLLKNINENIDNGKDINSSIDSAYKSHLNDRFGSGTGLIVNTLGKGYHTEKANEAVGRYKQSFSDLASEIGTKEASQVFKDMNKSIIDNYKNDSQSVKNGGTMKFKDYVNQGFDSLEEHKPHI